MEEQNFIQKNWYKNSSQAIQDLITSLSTQNDSLYKDFLKDLLQRDNTIGEISLLSIADIKIAHHFITVIFNVEKDNHRYTYEYITHRKGKNTGSKAVVLVAPLNSPTPTHFLFLKGERFATAQIEYDLVGGFSMSTESPKECIVRELSEEILVSDLEIDPEPLSLGEIPIDPGMTNIAPHLFLCTIRSDELYLEKKPPHLHLPSKEALQGYEMVEIENLATFIANQQVTALLTAGVGKLWAMGLLD